MTRQEFFQACEYFDWYFEMSDDHRIWKRGVARMQELKKEAAQDAMKQSILEAFIRHHDGRLSPSYTDRKPVWDDFAGADK